MGVVIRRSFGRLPDLKLTDRETMRAIGEEVRERIQRRTLSGQDVDGQPFEPYSDGYAKAKSEAMGTTKVDLAVSGEMLGGLTIVNVTDKSVTLGFRR